MLGYVQAFVVNTVMTLVMYLLWLLWFCARSTCTVQKEDRKGATKRVNTAVGGWVEMGEERDGRAALVATRD